MKRFLLFLPLLFYFFLALGQETPSIVNKKIIFDWWANAGSSQSAGAPVFLIAYDADPTNRFVKVSFTAGVYSSSDDAGVKVSDFTIVFAQNGGTATAASISSVKTISNTDLVGGESIIRVNLSFTGSPSGVESVTIKPSGNRKVQSLSAGYASTSTQVVITVSPTYDTDYSAVLNQASDNNYIFPIREYRTIENNFVADAKAKGVWTLTDLFYPLSFYGDVNYATLNWKTPASFKCTVGGTLPFTRGTGFTAGAGYLLTGWSPATNGVNFTLNAAAAVHASETNVASTTQIDYGTSHSDAVATKRIRNMTKDTGSTSQICLNSASTSTLAVVATSVGIFQQNRSASTAVGHKYYIDGPLADGSNATSGSLPDRAMVLMAEVNAAGTIANITTRKCTFYMFGGNMESIAASVATMWTTHTTARGAVGSTSKTITMSSGILTTNNGTTITTN